jgi:serine/threonine protein phosphatase 1
MFEWLRRPQRRAPDPPPIPRPDPDHRIYAVGDVHGRADLLDVLLARIEADAASFDDDRQPILLFLGDLVDRGEHSRAVLDRVLAAVLTWGHVVCLRGNHEAAMLAFLDDPVAGAAWLNYGGRQTLESYGIPAPPKGAGQELLREMPPMFRSGGVVFAHSGIDPARPLEAQDEDTLLWGRSDFLEGAVPEGLRVVHGHWARTEADITPDRVNVDTGAYYSGRLTAVRLDEGTELLSVDGLDL